MSGKLQERFMSTLVTISVSQICCDAPHTHKHTHTHTHTHTELIGGVFNLSPYALLRSVCASACQCTWFVRLSVCPCVGPPLCLAVCAFSCVLGVRLSLSRSLAPLALPMAVLGAAPASIYSPQFLSQILAHCVLTTATLLEPGRSLCDFAHTMNWTAGRSRVQSLRRFSRTYRSR